ncbi:unnamed protein product [Prunus armeniaca]
MVSGWSTKGYMACPVCKEDVTSGWHAEKVCYLGHRRWLPWDHEWREKDKEFDENTERGLRPREWSGDEILEQLSRLDFAPFGKITWRARQEIKLVLIWKEWAYEEFVSPVKFPDGYASNTVCCVNVDGGKFAGLKSHDCHVFMQCLLPVGIQHLLPEDVVKPIMLLSRFFSQLTAKPLRKTDINQLRHDIVQVLCKFEMIFPPAFFINMIHVMVHLPEKALLGGHVNYRWMYPIERLLGELKKTVCNRAKPEGSVIEAWVQYESLTFCGMYLLDVDTVFNRPQRNNNESVRNEKLSVFAQRARPFGDPVNKLKSSNSPTYSEELYNLAFGSIRAELFSGCHVNGIEFLGIARDDKLCTQNNGVHVPGGGESTNIDFYGKLTMVVQLLYKDRYQVIMFKCRWFDTNPNRQGSVKIDHGLLSVNINKTWYDDDPYILAYMAKQIVYLDDPKAGSGWKVVQQMD